MFTSHPRIRRCGVSVVCVDTEGSLRFGASINLPGNIQTVPRAEYYALYYLIKVVAPHSRVEYVTDHQPLAKTFGKGRGYAARCLNHDLLLQVFDLIQSKHLEVSIRWIPAHLKINDDGSVPVLPDGVSRCTS